MRDFDAEQQRRVDQTRPEDRTFTLAGQEWTLAPAINLANYLLLEDVGGNDALALRRSVEMIAASLATEDQRDSFASTVLTGDVSLRTFQDVSQWIVQLELGRPPTKPSASTNGRGSTGTPSTVASSRPAASTPPDFPYAAS